MAEKFRFFDPVMDENGNYDREYNAQEFVEYFSALVTTGVMKGAGNQLTVTADNASMVTKLDTGIAFILGRYYENDSILSHTHDTETLGKERIDRIVIRLDNSANSRFVKSFVKKGIASTTAVPPSLQQDGTIHEISVAQVKIIGGQTYISSANVTDERGTDIICPYAGSRILPNFDESSIGQPNGIATLDESGNVPMEQLQNVPLPQDASTTQKGVVQLNDSVTSTSTTQAATANAVKKVMESIPILNNTTSSTSTTQAATANAVKQVNDKLIGVSLSLGNSSESGANATALGYKAKAQGTNSTAVGTSLTATSTATSSLVLGHGSVVTAPATVAIGQNASSTNDNEGVLGVGGTTPGTKIWKVPGSFSVTGTKNFEIPHPHPDKKHTHVIRHGAVESPTTGDTLYRYEIEATEDGQTVELQLPDYFEHLNTNVDVWVNPHKHFGRAYGEVVGDKLLVTCEKLGIYKALVIGTRNDDNVQDWYIKGVEKEIGESWLGETYVFEVAEITEVTEFEEVFQ